MVEVGGTAQRGAGSGPEIEGVRIRRDGCNGWRVMSSELCGVISLHM